MEMKKFLVLFLLLAVPTFGQNVVVNGTQVTWDYDTLAEGVELFKLYGDRTSNVVPSPTTFLGSTAFPELIWTIFTPQPGRWFLVVTAANDTQTIESGPSNELEVIVVGKPTNFRISALLEAEVGIRRGL
jgi:hypothetical protein